MGERSWRLWIFAYRLTPELEKHTPGYMTPLYAKDEAEARLKVENIKKEIGVPVYEEGLELQSREFISAQSIYESRLYLDEQGEPLNRAKHSREYTQFEGLEHFCGG